MKKFEDFYKMTLVHFGTVSQKTGLKQRAFKKKMSFVFYLIWTKSAEPHFQGRLVMPARFNG